MNQFQTLWTMAEKEYAKSRGEKPEPQGKSDDATVKTAKAISNGLFHHELSDDEKKWAGPAVHYALGTLLGATYGLLAETVPKADAGNGTAYGSAVWLMADEIGVAAFGLAPPPSQTPLGSHVKGFVSHLLFGAATSIARKLILKKGPGLW